MVAVVLAAALMAVVTMLAPAWVMGLRTSGGADDGAGNSWCWAVLAVALLVLIVVVGGGSGHWWWCE